MIPMVTDERLLWLVYTHAALFLVVVTLEGACIPWGTFVMVVHSVLMYCRELNVLRHFSPYHGQMSTCLRDWITLALVLHGLSFFEVLLLTEYKFLMVFSILIMALVVIEIVILRRRAESSRIGVPPRPWTKHGVISKPEGQCPICLEEFAPTDRVVRATNCLHQYHDTCLGTWYDEADIPTCPTCRSDLRTTAIQQVFQPPVPPRVRHKTPVLCLTLMLLTGCASVIEIDHARKVTETVTWIRKAQEPSTANGAILVYDRNVVVSSESKITIVPNVTVPALFVKRWDVECSAKRKCA